MFIVTYSSTFGSGDTIEEAISNFEDYYHFDPESCEVYEAKEIKVQRKFEVIKED